MSTPSKVNKENFRLLDLSSDEESEDLQLEIIPSRKKKITRRDRRSRVAAPHTPEPNIGTEVQCALRWAVRGTLLLWLVMLTWICAALYDQMSDTKLQLESVSKTSAGVGGSIHECHAVTKDLQANATDLRNRLDLLEQRQLDLIQQVQVATKQLTSVADQLSAAPKLADTPRRLAELQRTVADFGSQINGFDGALTSAKKQAVTAVSGVEEIRTLLHQLEARTNETIANVTANAKRGEDIKSDIATLNSTIANKMEALQTRIQEISKPPSTPAPTRPSSTSSAAPQPTAGVSTPPTQPPGLPNKPIVLHSTNA